jgi:hypothetical protein
MIYYNELSEQTLRIISRYEERKDQAIKNDGLAHLFAKFSKDDFGKNVYSHSGTESYTPNLSVTVDSAPTVVRVLKWFREEGYKVSSFTDWTEYTPNREYKLISRNSEDTSVAFTVTSYFSGGTCEFVDEPTGEVEEVAEVVAIPAHRRQVMKKVLKCGTEELPSSV